MASSFRELEVWRKSIALAKDIYKITNRMLSNERFGLTSPMRRAAVSIPANIAEGNARKSRKDYIHFLTVARGPLAELETLLIIAQELGMVSEIQSAWESIGQTTRMLHALSNRLPE
ncbi:MAG: four helix bundle protein [Phycisphaerae bacterium]